MKKKTIFAIFFAMFIIYSIFVLENSDVKKIEDRYGIRLSGTEIISDTDTHGGFFGDGDRFTVFDVTEWKEKEDTINKWDKLPMTENLTLIMYGGDKDGTTYGFNLAAKGNVPYISNGRYYFIDRLHEIYTDSSLFSGASFNFTLFIFDETENKLYMVEFDT